MTDDSTDADPPDSRRSTVGTPVVRGDESVAGDHADAAVAFNPDDPADLDRAAAAVRQLNAAAGDEDHLFVLRGAAACATLARATGSYTAAADRAGDDVTVAFVRKWARVHDLPRPIRKQVATGAIVPTAAAHIARVSGADRYDLAWAVLDHDLGVRAVRSIVSDIDDDTAVTEVLANRGIQHGTITVDLPTETYRVLRHRAVDADEPPGTIVERALDAYFDG